jgi:hypothetical protein
MYEKSFQILINSAAPYAKDVKGKVEKLLLAEQRRLSRSTCERIKAQAKRTEWALLRDWIHVQLSMVQMQQAEAVQIFLPFMCIPNSDRTFFERLKEDNFKQLTEGQGVTR